MKVKEPLKLVSVTYPFMDLLKDQLEITLDVNNKEVETFLEVTGKKHDHQYEHVVHDQLWEKTGFPLNEYQYPLSLQQGDTIKLQTAFLATNENNPLTMYEFTIELLFEKEDGTFEKGIDYFHLHPYFTRDQIKSYIEKAGDERE